MDDQDLVSAAITASGLSVRRFAERIMGRDERTIHRWLSGDIAVPQTARAWLDRWLAVPETPRRAIVRSLNR